MFTTAVLKQINRPLLPEGRTCSEFKDWKKMQSLPRNDYKLGTRSAECIVGVIVYVMENEFIVHLETLNWQ